MAALGAERRFGLRCGRRSGARSVYLVKLTDTAMRTLEAFQSSKESLPNQPAICFKGSQGYIKIPAPSPESPDALRIFSFYLSSDNKDKPQGSFDCIHQYASGEGREHLEGQGSIQDKITVCATDDSYQVTRERLSQVEKDIWSRSAIEIKPGPSKSVKVQRKPGVAPSTEGGTTQSPSSKRSWGPGGAAQRPLRDRVLHLLALKPYRKPELLLWLERERAGSRDKAELSSVLDEIAKLNPKDQSFTLKDDVHRQLQRDWPGYLEEERSCVHRLLARKLQPLHGTPVKVLQSNHSFHKTPGTSPSQLSPAKSLSVKRPLPSDQLCQTPKKRRLFDQTSTSPSPAGGDPAPLGPRGSNGVRSRMEFELSAAPVPGSPSGSAGAAEPGPATPSPTPPRADAHPRASTGANRKRKSKKHRDKERVKPDWAETSPEQEKLHEQEGAATPVHLGSDPEPDYFLTYCSISALEQRQRYKDDFCAEYDEYRALHQRIGAVTQMFIQLGSKIHSLTPGTQEYQLMEEQILQKYRKYKKKFPGYREEKRRCEFLHQKLSHIKGLILDYDRAQGPR